MKKYYLIALLGVLVSAFACTEVSEMENPEEQIAREEIVISASQESRSQTKTILQEDGSVWWQPDDCISVFFGEERCEFHAYNTEPAAVANFIGNGPDSPLYTQGGNHWAVYPSPYRYYDEYPVREGESVTVWLPSGQSGVPGTFDRDLFISVAKSNDYSEFSFYNLCGGLAFCLETEGVKSVSFRGNAGEPLAGIVNVVMNSDGHPVVNEVRYAETEVTLSLSDGGYFVPGEWYYIVMLPTTLSEGYSMSFYTDTQKGEVVNSNPVEIKRSVFGRLKNPEIQAEFSLYPVYTIDDIYPMFRGIYIHADGYYLYYDYTNYLLLMSELRGDNVTQAVRTVHHSYEDNGYSDTPTSEQVESFWKLSYKIIDMCNQNIELLEQGESVETDHILGECYFLRALNHFYLVNLYATPYSRGAEMPGVLIDVSPYSNPNVRASVGEVYQQIMDDLEAASRLMKDGTRRGDAGYVSYETVRALLTRVHLYMGNYNDCISVAKDMLGEDAAVHLDDISTYFPNTRTSKETLWCVARYTDDPNYYYSSQSTIGSMYDYGGWCELHWSAPLMELALRHPEDRRLTCLNVRGETNDGKMMVYWPNAESGNVHRDNIVVKEVDFDLDASENTLVYNGRNYTVKRTVERTGYPEYYIENLFDFDDNDGFMGAYQTKVYVRNNMNSNYFYQYCYPMYAMSKFSYQDGDPTFSSPALFRWAEVVLNLAESYAQIGDEANALNYVNVIRRRAGIPEYNDQGSYRAEGYDNILDVVLDERRLELCFEGHRAIDLYRNGKVIDRRFTGVQPWNVLAPVQLDAIFPYCIPESVIASTGIAGNGKN